MRRPWPTAGDGGAVVPKTNKFFAGEMALIDAKSKKHM